MKKTYQTPVITAIDIAVESQILAGSTSLEFGKGSITVLAEWDTSWTTRRKKTTVRTGSNLNEGVSKLKQFGLSARIV